MCKKLTCLSFILLLGLVLGNVAGAAEKSNLIGWWKFDGDTLDYSGLGNDGTSFGNPTFITGKVGSGALNFDGDDYFTMDGVVDDFTGDDVTMAAWIKTTTTGEGDFFSMNPPSGDQFLLCILGGDILFYESGWEPAAGVSVNDGTWHHVVATRENMYVKIYVDGVYMIAGSYTSSVRFAASDRWSIAQEWDGSTPSDFYTGSVDDVRLYNRSLTAEQVEGLFNGIDPMFVKAENPDPADGAIYGATWASLAWSQGDTAVTHDVYFSDNFDDVNDGTGDAPRGNYDSTYFVVGFTGYPYPNGLVPGTTYYWRIDEVEADGTTTHRGDVWSFTVPVQTAHNPNPTDGDKYVNPDVVLGWTAGFGAKLHVIYFGDDFDVVSNATGGSSQVATTFKPGPLASDKVYYWRVDELTGTDTYKGEVWSFTTRPVIPIVDPNLVGWWKLDDEGAAVAVDYSGYDHYGLFKGDPQYVTGYDGDALEFDGDDYVVLGSGGVLDFGDATDFSILLWIKWAGTSSDPAFISNKNWDSGGNTGYAIADGGSTWQWNYSGSTGSRADYDPDGPTLTDNKWHHLCITHDRDGYAVFYVDGVYQDKRDISGSTGSIDTGMPHVLAQDGTTTYGSTYSGLIDDVRIYNKVLSESEITIAMRGDTRLAWGPSPANGSVPDIAGATPLSWSPGENASRHDVYFGTDKNAVSNADSASTTDIYRGRQNATSYTPPEGVEWAGGPYYWRIDEYNTDGTINRGRLWSFTVADYLIVDDFESYDAADNQIWYAWHDGLGYGVPGTDPYFAGNGTGASVGDETTSSYTEETVVQGGSQSMPLSYNNNKQGYSLYSEAELKLTAQRDWTRQGVTELSLWFRGYPASVGSFTGGPAGTYTMTASGEDIWGTSDQFHYAWKELSGAGTIIAKIESVQNTDGWAKAGVMIRDSLDPNSAHTMVVMTPGNGVSFQYRGTAGGSSGNANLGGITSPQWVKLERNIGGNVTAYYSANGGSWTPVDVPVSIAMNPPVYIGLVLTSHVSGMACEAKFSNVTITGTVSPQWTNQDIGILSNAAVPLYVAVSNNAGSPAVLVHDDPVASTIDTWTEWVIPLEEIANQGVSLTNVDRIAIGLGTRGNMTIPGGSGKMFFDDIRLYRPAP